jgi:hypothetical protein
VKPAYQLENGELSLRGRFVSVCVLSNLSDALNGVPVPLESGRPPLGLVYAKESLRQSRATCILADMQVFNAEALTLRLPFFFLIAMDGIYEKPSQTDVVYKQNKIHCSI